MFELPTTSSRAPVGFDEEFALVASRRSSPSMSFSAKRPSVRLLTGNLRRKDERDLWKAELTSVSSGRAVISIRTDAPCSTQRLPAYSNTSSVAVSDH